MSIKRHKRGDKVYVCEYKQVREGDKVKSIYLRSLGPEEEVKKGKKSNRRVLDRLNLQRSYRAGDVKLLWSIAQNLDFVNIIDGICCGTSHVEGVSPGKLLTVWAINRVLDPESCTQLEYWVPTTELPLLSGLKPEEFTKDAFLSSLDFVCYKDNRSGRLVDHSAALDDTFYQKWRHDYPLPSGEGESVAYDLTSVLFFGVTCPLAEFGEKAKKANRRQVNLAVIVSKHDKQPIAHFVYNGCKNSLSTVKNLIARLNETDIKPGTVVMDRGNVSKENVKSIEGAGWKVICGVPKSSKEVQTVIENATVPIDPLAFTHKSKTDTIYSVKTSGILYGEERKVTVYVNENRRVRNRNALNETLAVIGEELDELSEKGKEWSEGRLHKEIKKKIEGYEAYIHATVKRMRGVPRIDWKFKSKNIEKANCSPGRYLLLSTDESLSSKAVVKTYFEKDFVEKVFRTFKTEEKIEPVRHRLENRVRAYMFVCVLAYRLLAALRFRLAEAKIEGNPCEQTFELLRSLGRVEHVDVNFGKEVKTYYLNQTDKTKDILKKIGMKNLLAEETRLTL